MYLFLPICPFSILACSCNFRADENEAVLVSTHCKMRTFIAFRICSRTTFVTLLYLSCVLSLNVYNSYLRMYLVPEKQDSLIQTAASSCVALDVANWFLSLPGPASWDACQQKEMNQRKLCFLCLGVGFGGEVSWGSCGMCHSGVIDDLHLAGRRKINSKTWKGKKKVWGRHNNKK